MEGILEIKTYVKFAEENKNVKTVRELIDIETGEVTYRGFGMIGLTINGKTVPQELEFDLPGADSIQKCFEVYDDSKKEEGKRFLEMLEQARMEHQKQIVIPGR